MNRLICAALVAANSATNHCGALSGCRFSARKNTLSIQSSQPARTLGL